MVVIKTKTYEEIILKELIMWQIKMVKKPSLSNRLTKGVQNRVNNIVPDKVHEVITGTIKNMVKAVLFGSGFITKKPLVGVSLEDREKLVKESIAFYKRTAAISGAGTGYGGILLGLADLPVLLSLKIKFLFNVASLYGFNVSDYKERIYILYIFQLAFSSQEKRNKVYKQISDWENKKQELPKDMNLFQWKEFQQEYRDYIDIAKMLQLVPIIGAPIGAFANYRLLDNLGKTAMNAYRLRLIKS
ncbi:MAG: ABC transporter-associated protein EcsC [Desulfitibacter sp. BRH_c19]|nr:MAG: ABC transporter-associated protein EcsC [Desulfitibacter sp. BRH_c19]